jgi:hypothetical protein
MKTEHSKEFAMTVSNPDPNRRSTGSMPDNAGDETTKQKIKEDVQDVKHEVGAKARESAEAGQHRLADEADALSEAIDAAASSLDDHDRQGLARYARELSSTIANAAGQLEGRSVDELANDAKSLARNNPAMFMLGSIAVGFGLSRFFKASADRDHQDATTHRSNSSFRDDDVSTGTPGHGRERDMTKMNAASAAPLSADRRDTQ